MPRIFSEQGKRLVYPYVRDSGLEILGLPTAQKTLGGSGRGRAAAGRVEAVPEEAARVLEALSGARALRVGPHGAPSSRGLLPALGESDSWRLEVAPISSYPTPPAPLHVSLPARREYAGVRASIRLGSPELP